MGELRHLHLMEFGWVSQLPLHSQSDFRFIFCSLWFFDSTADDSKRSLAASLVRSSQTSDVTLGSFHPQ